MAYVAGILAPLFAHFYMEIQIYLFIHKILDHSSRAFAQLLDCLAALADENAFLRLPFDNDDYADIIQVVALIIFYNTNLRRIENFLEKEQKKLLANHHRHKET